MPEREIKPLTPAQERLGKVVIRNMYRDFEDYQTRTQREIPVVILSPL